MTRTIGLIEAEFSETCRELADCMRDQAENIVKRARGVENCGIEAADRPCGLQAKQLNNEAHINSLMQDELKAKLSRLEFEYQYLKEGK